METNNLFLNPASFPVRRRFWKLFQLPAGLAEKTSFLLFPSSCVWRVKRLSATVCQLGSPSKPLFLSVPLHHWCFSEQNGVSANGLNFKPNLSSLRKPSGNNNMPHLNGTCLVSQAPYKSHERRYCIAHFTDEKTEVLNYGLVEIYLQAQYFYFISSAV